MSINTRQVWIAKLEAIRATLARTPHGQKTGLIAKELATNFNELVDEIRAGSPDIAAALPKRISSLGPERRLKADVTYIDLEVFCEQVLNLLRVSEEHNAS